MQNTITINEETLDRHVDDFMVGFCLSMGTQLGASIGPCSSPFVEDLIVALTSIICDLGIRGDLTRLLGEELGFGDWPEELFDAAILAFGKKAGMSVFQRGVEVGIFTPGAITNLAQEGTKEEVLS